MEVSDYATHFPEGEFRRPSLYEMKYTIPLEIFFFFS